MMAWAKARGLSVRSGELAAGGVQAVDERHGRPGAEVLGEAGGRPRSQEGSGKAGATFA